MMYLVKFIADLSIDTSDLPNNSGNDAPSSMLSTALSTIFAIIGAVSLLMIVISGLRYITAAGDPSKMSQAKSAIIYAVIGLAVALSGFSIVTFVVKGIG